MTKRICHQVFNHLLDSIRIADHLIGARRHPRCQLDVAGLCLLFMPIDDVLEHPTGGEDSDVERADAVFQAREIEQVFDDPI